MHRFRYTCEQMGGKHITAAQMAALIVDPRTELDLYSRFLRKPLAGIGPEVLAQGALRSLNDGEFVFARNCKGLPVVAIRLFLEALPLESAWAVFIHASVDARSADDVLLQTWQRAVQTMLDLISGSSRRAARYQAVAQNPELMQAIAAAAVSGHEVPRQMLELLLLEGSEASVDALMPTFMAGHSLDALDDLRPAKPSKAMKVMFEKVSALLAERNRSSPAIAFAEEHLGLVATDRAIAFIVRIESAQPNRAGVPLYQGVLRILSESESWFSVSLGKVDPGARLMPTTGFGAKLSPRDDLGLGLAPPVEWPRWLARAAKKLKVTWVITGKKRDRPLIEFLTKEK